MRSRRCAAGSPQVWLSAFFLLASSLAPSLSRTPGTDAASGESARLLRKADAQRVADYPGFRQTLRLVERRPGRLPQDEADYLHFLEAWRDSYEGHDAVALAELRALIPTVRDPALAFRAQVTAVHVLSQSRHYDEAYALLAGALERMPRIKDGIAREQALLDASELYSDVGQYELSVSYAQLLIDENWAGRGRCEGETQRVRALYEAGRLDDDAPVRAAIQDCTRAGEALFTATARLVLARLYCRHQRHQDAIRVLAGHYDEVERLYNPRFVTAYNALLAEAYLRRGAVSLAHELARRVTVAAIDRFGAPLAGAYHVLYEIARDQGDYRAALGFHERYAAVDKAYLDEISARELAFQRIKHEGLARQLQVATLHRENSVLQLQKQLSEEAAKTSRLQVTLLSVVLTFLGMMTALTAAWAWRTKRLQLHFMKMSRIDSMTGIYNRPYFIEQAESLLAHSRRAGLEVSVVLWDADHFKAVNDRHGHAAGDSVLRRMAGSCREHLRRTDVLGRFGGEEFAIVLPGCSADEGAERADILRTAMSRLSVLEGRPDSGTVSASFGVTCSTLSGYDLGRLLGHADAALYTAKRTGRNRVVVYDSTRDEPDPEGGTAGDRSRAAAHAHGTKAREEPASGHGPPRPRDGQLRPYRGRTSAACGSRGRRSLCCGRRLTHDIDTRWTHGRKAAQDCRRGGVLHSGGGAGAPEGGARPG